MLQVQLSQCKLCRALHGGRCVQHGRFCAAALRLLYGEALRRAPDDAAGPLLPVLPWLPDRGWHRHVLGSLRLGHGKFPEEDIPVQRRLHIVRLMLWLQQHCDHICKAGCEAYSAPP